MRPNVDRALALSATALNAILLAIAIYLAMRPVPDALMVYEPAPEVDISPIATERLWLRS